MNTLRCFFICSCLLLIFAGINYTIAPTITAKKYGEDCSWHTLNCKLKSDKLEDLKKDSSKYEPEKYRERYESYSYDVDYCRFRVATFTLENISFNFNIIIGFVCLLISLFSTQDKKIPQSHLIGMICGITGFLLSLIYIIILGILYTQYYPTEEVYKRESDGAVAENAGSNGFRCFYYSSKGDIKSFFAKFFDYIKSQYNYNKELIDSYKNEAKEDCTINGRYDIEECANEQYLKLPSKYDNCKIIYYNDKIHEREGKKSVYYDILHDLSVKMLIALLITLLLLLIYGALIFSSFNLTKVPSGYSQI